MSSDGCGAQAGPGSSAQSPSNEADPGSPSNLASLKPMLEVVGLIAAPLSIVTSVLVYFGIVGAQVEANFFGLDPADYNYSNQEHISRSIAPMLGPLAMAGAAIAVGIQANSLAARKADHIAASARLQHVAAWALHLGIVSIVFGAAWQWRLGSRHSYWAPIFMGVGGIASAGARGVLAMVEAKVASPQQPRSPASALDAGSKMALSFVVTFAAFGFAARLAQAEGFDRARDSVIELDQQSTVSVLSEDPLIINRRGVACFEVRGSLFTRRYVGLHLVAHRNGRYFLVPAGFDTNNAITIVLDEAESLRVEYDASPMLRAEAGLDPKPAVEAPNGELIC